MDEQIGMTRRRFLQLTAAAGAMAAMPQVGLAANAPAKRPPNLLFIMADDGDLWDLGCYGNAKAETPHIDGLARRGVQFTTCWATPLCAPTRAMLMSGRYAHQTGFYSNSQFIVPMGKHGQDYLSHNRSFADFLKGAGYATAIAGKWQQTGYVERAGRAGFDEYYLHEPFPAERDLKAFKGLVLEGKMTSQYWHPCFFSNGRMVETKPEDFGEGLCADFLIDFMRRNRERPFFAYFPLNLPHLTGFWGGKTAAIPSTPLSGKVGDMSGGSLPECMAYIDSLVGRLVATLEELGLRENTVVFLTSDNGGAGKGKGTHGDDACRIPMVVNGPGLIRSRGRTRHLMSLVDVLPTFMGFAGARLPADYPIDGKDLSPFLRGESEQTRPWIYSYEGTARMLRDERWVLEDVDLVFDNPRGRFFDCSGSPESRPVRDVTNSEELEVLRARKRFDDILASIPHLDYTDPQTQEALRGFAEFYRPLQARRRAAAARAAKAKQ